MDVWLAILSCILHMYNCNRGTICSCRFRRPCCICTRCTMSVSSNHEKYDTEHSLSIAEMELHEQLPIYIGTRQQRQTYMLCKLGVIVEVVVSTTHDYSVRDGIRCRVRMDGGRYIAQYEGHANIQSRIIFISLSNTFFV